MMAINFGLYVLSFVVIWMGSGLIISSVDKLSKKLAMSSFAVSFFVLGILTSIPEIAVGLTSIPQGTPEIYVGNLLGGIIIIFLLIIPTLAILGKGVKLNHDLDKSNIFLSLIVIFAPFAVVLDKSVSVLEGFLLIALYLMLFYVIQKKHGFLNIENKKTFNLRAYSLIDIFRVLGGVCLVLVSSQIIVSKTLFFAEFFNISTFYISLMALSLGTNMPELTLAFRSIVSGKKDVAFGDYLGSAAANTLLLGVFVLLDSSQTQYLNGNFLVPLMFTFVGLSFFYFFGLTQKNISREEGVVLLVMYILFIVIEVIS